MASTPLNPHSSVIKRSLHLSPVLVISGLMAGPAIAQTEPLTPNLSTEPPPQDAATPSTPQPEVKVSAEPAVAAAVTPRASPQPQFSVTESPVAEAQIPTSVSYSAADLEPLPESSPVNSAPPSAQFSVQSPTVSNIAPPTTQDAPQMSSGLADESPELSQSPSRPTPQFSQAPFTPSGVTNPSAAPPPRSSLTFSGPQLAIPNATVLPEGAVPTVSIDYPETQERAPSLTEASAEASSNTSPSSTSDPFSEILPSAEIAPDAATPLPLIENSSETASYSSDSTEARPCPEVPSSELSESRIQAEICVAEFSFRRYTGSSSLSNSQSEPLLFHLSDLENIKLPGGSRTIGEVQNRLFNPAGLSSIADSIAQFYSDRGYTTSGAVINVLEPTSSDPQLVYIEVIESVLEYTAILPEENADRESRLRLERYVRQRLGVRENQPLNTTRLQEAVILLSLDPLIDNIRAEVTDGSGTGRNRLTIWVEEANPFDFAVGSDNAGAPSIGAPQRGISASYGNVLGWGDRLAANYLNTDGSNELGLSYVLPVTPQNGTLSLRFNTKQSGIIEPPFDDIDGDGSSPDIRSDSQTYEVSLRQPILRSITPQNFSSAPDLTYIELALGLTLSVRNTGTRILDIPIGLSPDGRTHTTAVRFFQDWTQQNARSAFGARSQFNLGVNAFGASVIEQVPALGALPDSQFFSWQGLAQWNYVLNPTIRSRDPSGRYAAVPDQVLILRGGVQLADRPLLPNEQFELGGVGTVRGYRQSALQTDNGFSASAEGLFAVMTVPEVNGVLQVIPFVGFGMGWDNAGRVNPDQGTLASIGLGLQWQMRGLTARLDYGIPLISAPERSTGRTWQEKGVSFSITYNP